MVAEIRATEFDEALRLTGKCKKAVTLKIEI
jgi:hypothetical protein